jgi:hypothetical protein
MKMIHISSSGTALIFKVILLCILCASCKQDPAINPPVAESMINVRLNKPVLFQNMKKYNTFEINNFYSYFGNVSGLFGNYPVK